MRGTPPRPLWRRIVRIVGRVLAGLAGLVVLAIVFLHTPWGKAVVRGRIEHALAGKVNGSVHVGSLDYGFLFGTISIGDVEIRAADGQPAIAIGSIDLALDRGALLHREVILDDLAIAGLVVTVVKHVDGTTNLTGLFKPSTGKPLGHVRIAKLSVKGRATLTKPDGTTTAIRDLELAGSVDARPAAKQVELALERVAATVESKSKQLAISLEAVSVKRRPDAFDVEIAKLGAGVVAIEALAAHVQLDHGKPRGPQSITIGKARVDSKQLATLLGREVVVDDLAIDLSITGPAKALVLHGALRTRDTSLAIDGTLDIVAALPRYELTVVGKGRSTDVLVPRAKPRPTVETDVRIDIAGTGLSPADLDAVIGLAIGPTKIGAIAIDGVEAHATAKHGAYHLERLAAHGLGFDVTASGDLAADKTLAAHVNLVGGPAHAVKILAAAGITIPRRIPTIGKLALEVTATGKLDGELAVEVAPTRIALAGGSVGIAGTARLDHKRLQGASARIVLDRLDLGALARLAGRPPTIAGSLSGSLQLTRTPTTLDASYDLRIALRDQPLVIIAAGTTGTSTTARATVRRTGDRAVIATLRARLPLDRRGFHPSGAWNVTVDVAQRELGELAALLPARLRGKLPAGDIAVRADLAGSPRHPSGTITLTASAAALRGVPGRQQLALRATLAPSRRGLTVTTDGTVALAGDDPLVTLHGTVAMPFAFRGKRLDVAALRAGLTIDTTIDIPERPLASLASVRAKLAELDGQLGGRIIARGPAKTPTLEAKLAWRGYRTAAGGTGDTRLAVTGTATALTATIDHGDGLQISADIDRRDLDRIAIRTHARAAKLPLLTLIPAAVAGNFASQTPGALDWNMDGAFVLARAPSGALALDQASVTGSLDLTGGAFAIPNSHRRYHDIALAVVGEPNGVRIKSLVLHETDVENSDRTLTIAGLLALDKLRPTHLDLSLAARDWLVFGTDKLGLADAPRATATFDIGVAVDLSRPVLDVDATIDNLALLAPDRQDRGHYPERVSVSGDIIYVDRDTRIGRLPVTVAAATAPRKRRPIDVRIHIPRPIHVQQTPMDLRTHGELTVAVRDEGVATRGTLVMDGGTLDLFGRDHALVDGTLTFSDEHPHGWLAVTFERELPDYALRELANPDVPARISFSGGPTTPKAKISGSANAAMTEVMAMYNAGRPLHVTRPGQPASETVEAPRGDQLFVLTFMASNLPHLLFLDRIDAWADPSDYGNITNLEAERYARDRKSRVRAVVRPTTPGRSTAELQYDRMLLHDAGTAFGVGVRAGDRLGGGVGLFFEWSSRD